MASQAASLDLTELAQWLGGFDARAHDLTPVMALIANDLAAAVDENFETAGHGQWPALAPSTLARRRGTTAQILVDTGIMRGGVHPSYGADFAEAVTDSAYAVFHVSKAPRSLIPLRDFLDIPLPVYEAAYEELTSYVFDEA